MYRDTFTKGTSTYHAFNAFPPGRELGHGTHLSSPIVFLPRLKPCHTSNDAPSVGALIPGHMNRPHTRHVIKDLDPSSLPYVMPPRLLRLFDELHRQPEHCVHPVHSTRVGGCDRKCWWFGEPSYRYRYRLVSSITRHKRLCEGSSGPHDASYPAPVTQDNHRGVADRDSGKTANLSSISSML